MAEVLLEIGTEELPARVIEPAAKALAAEFERSSLDARLPHGAVRSFGTPRRLAIRVSDVATTSEPSRELRLGPPVARGLDATGHFTVAAEQFAARLGVRVEDLTRRDTPKGSYLAVELTTPEKPAMNALSAVLSGCVEHLTFPKSMRWNDTDRSFARPVRRLTALLDGDVVPLTFAGVVSDRVVEGPRDALHSLDHATRYESVLRAAGIFPAIDERRRITLERIREAAASAQAVLVDDEALLDEVTELVDAPVAVVGSFDARFLELPRDVIVEQMKTHLRTFALADEQGRLLPRFVAVTTAHVRDPARVARGTERVLRARLADARFFWEQDRRMPLAGHAEKLARRTWVAPLGTMAERTARIRALALWLATKLSLGHLAASIERVAVLCKADLETAVVSELPALHGVIGKAYAELDGEPDEVARGIFEHCLPRTADDRLPASDAGAIVGIADRLDTLAGLFSIGRQPSGSGDPLGLRRAALGLARIVEAHAYALSLPEAVERALSAFSPERPSSEIGARILDAIRTRLEAHWRDTHPHDVVSAVLGTPLVDLVDASRRCRAITALSSAQRAALREMARRVSRIAVSPSDEETAENGDVPVEPEELALDRAVSSVETVERTDHAALLDALLSLREPTAAFFESVLVMAPERAARERRLALLRRIRDLLGSVARFELLRDDLTAPPARDTRRS